MDNTSPQFITQSDNKGNIASIQIRNEEIKNLFFEELLSVRTVAEDKSVSEALVRQLVREVRQCDPTRYQRRIDRLRAQEGGRA